MGDHRLGMAKVIKHRDRPSVEVAMAIAAQDIQDDYAEHMHDYRQFVRIVQIVVAGVATVLLLLAFFLL